MAQHWACWASVCNATVMYGLPHHENAQRVDNHSPAKEIEVACNNDMYACTYMRRLALLQAGRLGWPVSVLLGHTAPVTFVDFCRAVPDALLSSSFDGTCRVWDARAGGAALHVLRASPGFAPGLDPNPGEAGAAAQELTGLGRRPGSAGGAGPSRAGEGAAAGSGLGSPWATGVFPWGYPPPRPASASARAEAAAGSPRQQGAPAGVPGPAGGESGTPENLAGPAPGAADDAGAGAAGGEEARAGDAGDADADDAAPANVRPEQEPADHAAHLAAPPHCALFQDEVAAPQSSVRALLPPELQGRCLLAGHKTTCMRI